MEKLKVQNGDIYGNWKILKDLGILRSGTQLKHYVLVICKCGNEKKITLDNLRRNKSTKCHACASTGKKPGLIHGKRHTSEYHAWVNMKQRCENPKCKSYKNYGARGIKVCKRWSGKNGFINFFKDMGTKPSRELSLDRINNDGNYEPSNCRWASSEIQNNNHRKSNQYSEKRKKTKYEKINLLNHSLITS